MSFNIGYLELGLNGEILVHNDQLAWLIQSIKDQGTIANLLMNLQKIDKWQIGKDHNFLLLTNVQLPDRSDQAKALAINYICLTLNNSSAKVYIVNYLTWINNIVYAKDCAYSYLSEVNEAVTIADFYYLSQVHAFKALHPLFTSPKSYYTKLYARSMFDTAHAFFNNKEPSRINDYINNVLGSVTKQISKDQDDKYLTWVEGLEFDSYKIEYSGEYFVPQTELKDSVILNIKPDNFLNNLLKTQTGLNL